MNVVDSRDGPVAVQRDGDEVEDRRRAADDVEGHPRVAQFPAEEPARADLLDDGKRHDERGDEQVGDGQRRDQIVGDRPQVALDRNGRDHEYIADDRRQDDRSEDDEGYEQSEHAEPGRETPHVERRGPVHVRRRRRGAVDAQKSGRRPVMEAAVDRADALVDSRHR